MEKIKWDKNRVDINKLNPDETTGDNLTGGYIVKVDKTGDLSYDEFFHTYPSNTYNNARSYTFTYVYPKYDEIVSQQKAYIHDFLLDFENSLNGSSFKDPNIGFRKYLDINSFLDFQIIQELTNNVDGYRYSTFFYKKKDSDGGKLFAGPLWDFDLCYGNVNYSELNLSTDRWLYTNYGPNENFTMHWWARLMEDEGYRYRLVARWKQLRAGAFKTDSIMAYLNTTITYLGEAVDRNFVRWPILGKYVWPNHFIGNTYEEEVNWLKNWITERLNWMDVNIELADTNNNDYKRSLLIYPNPVNNRMNIRIYLFSDDKIDIEIFDMLGRKVFNTLWFPEDGGYQNIELAVPRALQGYYILQVKQTDRVIGRQKLIINNRLQ